MTPGMPDPEIPHGNNSIIDIWNNERSKYIMCSFSGNRPSHVEMAGDLHDSSAPIVYGPASDAACWRFIDAQCARAVNGHIIQVGGTLSPVTVSEPVVETPIQQMHRIDSIELLQNVITTLHKAFDDILALDGHHDDDGEPTVYREDINSIIAKVYTPGDKPPSIPQLSLERPFDKQEFEDMSRGPFYDIVKDILFGSSAGEHVTVGAMRAKMRMSMAKFKVDIRSVNNPYMLDENGFPQVMVITAKNNLARDVLWVACTDFDIADSYREYASVIHGANDYSIKVVPVNYLPLKSLVAGLSAMFSDTEL